MKYRQHYLLYAGILFLLLNTILFINKNPYYLHMGMIATWIMVIWLIETKGNGESIKKRLKRHINKEIKYTKWYINNKLLNNRKNKTNQYVEKTKKNKDQA